jgi:cytochrome P450
MRTMADQAAADFVSLPPGPLDAPEQQARLWIEQPDALLEDCQRRFGDLFTLRLGGFGTIVIVADPDGVARVFEMAAEDYECRHFNGSYRYVMGDHALFLQDGAPHRALKGMVAPSFAPSSLAHHADTIRAVIDDMTRDWGERGEVRLRPALHAIALACLLELVLGRSAALSREIRSWFEAKVWTDLRSWKSWTALSRLRPAICERIDAELDRLRAQDEPANPSLLASLFAARKGARAALSNAEIHDQIMMLMITAVDALAVGASWALVEAARDAALQQRLRDERADLGAGATTQAILDLPWLSATMREVLRLHPVLPTVSGRRVTTTQDFRGYRIPAETTLAPCQYLVHRRADLFEEPLAFRPERFLGQSYPRHHYFPFGGSVRACLGSTLAPMTGRLILSDLLARFAFVPVSESPPATVRHGTLMAPAEDCAIRIERLQSGL